MSKATRDARILKEIEKACSDVCDTSTNMYIPWYIMAAYAYYVEDSPILSDRTFDNMSKRILENWDEIEHIHKKYLNKDMLEARNIYGGIPLTYKRSVAKCQRYLSIRMILLMELI